MTLLVVSCGSDDPDPCEGYDITVERSDDNVFTITSEGTPYTYSIAYEGIETPQEGASQEATITVEADEFAAATISVTNTNNCKASKTAVAANPCLETDLAATITRTVGEAQADNINFAITGGGAPYNYSITYEGEDTPQTGESEAGTFTVAATNMASATVTVTDALGCSANESIDASVCLGFEVVIGRDKDDMISFTITEGTAPFSYSISYEDVTAPQTGSFEESTHTVNAEEDYAGTVSITDDNGCIVESDLVEYPCLGYVARTKALDGIISVRITKGTSPYSYSIKYDDTETLQTGTSDEREFDIEVETFNKAASLSITDANGCELTTNKITAYDINSFIDTRDQQRYGYVLYNGEFWMTENFNYAYPERKCYGDVEGNCATYGGLYTLAMATANGFAPNGWKLPSTTDVESVFESIGGDNQAYYAALIEGGSTGIDIQLGGLYANAFYRLGEQGLYWLTSPEGTVENHFILNSLLYAFIQKTDEGRFISVRFIKE